MASQATIVLDESCAHLRTEVARFATVQVFRRVDGFRCESRIAAAELYQMLVDHSILGRTIYVAPSFAGFTALLLANEHPGSLIGMLLLDPSHPRQSPEALRILADVPTNSKLEGLRSLLAGFGSVWEQSCRDVAGVRNLGSLTLHVLAGGKFDLIDNLSEDIKVRLMDSRCSMLLEYCALSSNATFEVVETAGHDVSHQAPEAVLSAIRRILSAIKMAHDTSSTA